MINLKPNEQRAKAAIILIWIVFAIEMLSMISSIMQYYFLKSIENGDINLEAAIANDQREMIISVFHLVTLLASGITFILWFQRAYSNMHLLRGSRLQFKAGWATGAWFVPVVSFFRPFGIMKEMHENAEEMLYEEKLTELEDRRFQTLGAWWTFWVISNILSSILRRIEAKSESLETLTYVTIGYIVGSIIFIPLTMLAVRVIKNYAEMEKLLPELKNVDTLTTSGSTDLLDS